jgi:signal recognition particle GTPase
MSPTSKVGRNNQFKIISLSIAILIDRIKRHYSQRPFVILFLGTNGTGKTTTIAKIAN